MSVTSRTVLITGGNRGLGRALVETFSSNGWKVLATARKPESLPETVSRFALDLSNHDEVLDAVSKITEEMADTKIDVVIHNAGFNPKDNKSVEGYFASTFRCNEDFSAANVAESMMINALHPMEFTGKLLPVLADDGVVIAISSWLGSIGAKKGPGHYGYCGSKALMNLCIKGLSLEFERDDHHTRTAIALNPGWMKTDMGGSKADISPEEVAGRIIAMLDDGFFIANNGKFLNTDRTEHPW